VVVSGRALGAAGAIRISLTVRADPCLDLAILVTLTRWAALPKGLTPLLVPAEQVAVA